MAKHLNVELSVIASLNNHLKIISARRGFESHDRLGDAAGYITMVARKVSSDTTLLYRLCISEAVPTLSTSSNCGNTQHL